MGSPGPIAIRNLDRGERLGDRIRVAGTWWTRARGLLGHTLADGEGLLIRPCRAVHMLGMRYPIDVAFLDGEHRVVATYPELRPAGMTRYHKTAESALELPAGTLARTGTRVGDRLAMISIPTDG